MEKAFRRLITLMYMELILLLTLMVLMLTHKVLC
jgi:hypothetical protein